MPDSPPLDLAAGEARWEHLHVRFQGTRDALVALGVVAEGAGYVAEQRALRVYLLLQGKPMPRAQEEIAVRDRNLYLALSSVWMDGLGVGVATIPAVLPSRALDVAQLAEAVRSNDSLSEELGDIIPVIARAGLKDTSDLMDMAMARARRTVSAAPVSKFQAKRGTPMLLTAAGGLWTDGMAAGVAACARFARDQAAGPQAEPS